MILKYLTKLQKSNGDFSSQELSNNLEGGSDSKFDYATTYNQATELSNNFSVKEVQIFSFELPNGNTFNRNIFELINANFSDITFIQITCHESVNDSKIPIRFNVNLRVDGSAALFNLGKMSILTLANLYDNKVDQIFLNELTVPADNSAFLSIIIGTKNDN